MTSPYAPEPQADYAYVPVAHYLSHPIRVTVLRPNGPQHSEVLVHHPDEPTTRKILDNSLLTDRWDERPSSAMWPGYQGEHTWMEIAEQTYQHVLDERSLAQRLSDLGVHRLLRHYAGRGGTSIQSGEADAQLTLSHNELDYLLRLAERGKEGGISATKETE